MRKIILFLFLSAGFLGACKKDDHVFDKSPDERINETLAAYQSTLQGSPAGWEATLTTGTGALFNFHFRFNESNRVFMFCDFDETTASEEKESSYRLKSLQQPVLIFDTYSYVHLLGDPNGLVNGGNDGEGLLTDFEYSLDTLYADSILLTGRFYGTKLKLVRASQEDYDAWQNGIWVSNLSFLKIQDILEYFKRFRLDGVTYELYVNPVTRTILINWESGGTVRSFTTRYYFDRTGLVFEQPLVNGSTTITGFSDFEWNAGNHTMQMEVNGKTTTIAGATAPIRVDLNAPRRWWQTVANSDTYWISWNGFHVNGVDDAYGVNSIPNYYFMIFWPAFGTSGGIRYDLLGFVTYTSNGLALGFGAGYSPPQFTSDGRVIFDILGILGTVPPEAEEVFEKTAIRLNDADGFYLVQTSAGTYDMVSADDARSWINWTY